MSDTKWHSGTAPTREEVLTEIARELAMRRSVFPRWVEAGKLKQAEANKRIDRLQAGYDFIMERWPREQQALGL